MTDIVERLRDKWVCAALPVTAPEAADTIESLRAREIKLREIAQSWADKYEGRAKRVAELEALYKCANEDANTFAKELAALKAGPIEPVLYQCSGCGGANYGCTCETLNNCIVPLFTQAPKP